MDMEDQLYLNCSYLDIYLLFVHYLFSLVECEFHRSKEHIFAAIHARYGFTGCVLQKGVAAEWCIHKDFLANGSKVS